MLFTGESGTGKSTSARVIPYRCGIPYVSINFSVNIEEADLFGSMIPNPTKKDASDPEFIWQDGIITKAIRNGYCTILEEINFARPGVLGKLNSLLDENRQIDLPNGEILKAHKNFRMIATCNIAYEGTNRFNKALINRFEVVHEFKDLEKTEAFKAIKDRIKGVDDTKLSAIYTVYELLKKYSKEQGLDLVVSIRQLFNVFRQGKYYANAYDAVIDTIINGAFVELPEYKDKFVETLNSSAIKSKLTFKI
jgi:MoxR-like ATPase